MCRVDEQVAYVGYQMAEHTERKREIEKGERDSLARQSNEIENRFVAQKKSYIVQMRTCIRISDK